MTTNKRETALQALDNFEIDENVRVPDCVRAALSAPDLVAAPSGGETVDKGEVSDGYHTFNELYEHRHALFIALAKAHPDKAWKSWEHDDGSLYEGWFIAGIETPEGQVTYHLPARLWDAFKGEFKYRAPKWDGHTPADVINRLAALTSPPPAKDDGVDLDKIVETLKANLAAFVAASADIKTAAKITNHVGRMQMEVTQRNLQTLIDRNREALAAIEAVKQARGRR